MSNLFFGVEFTQVKLYSVVLNLRK